MPEAYPIVHSGVSRRRFLGVSAAAAAAVTVPWSRSAWSGTTPGPGISGVLPEFAAPTLAFRPRWRWWWGLPYVDQTCVEELTAMADAGFSAAEVSFGNTVLGFLASSVTGVGAAAGWGTPDQRRMLTTALETVRSKGARLDQTLGFGWPVRTPRTGGGTGYSQLELMYGRVDVAGPGTFAGPVPTPVGDEHNTRGAQLIAVTAARVLQRGPAVTAVDVPPARSTVLDPESFIDLTDRALGAAEPPLDVAPGAALLTWDVPEGDWILFGHWRRTSTLNTILHVNTVPGPPTPMNYFDPVAAQVALDDIETLQIGPENVQRLRGANEYFFEDSLENAWQGLPWTHRMQTEFSERRGYDLTRWLPLLYVQKKYTFPVPITMPPADFELPDGSAVRLRRDFDHTLTDLYVDHHLEPFQAWSAARGSTFRAQVSYGVIFDGIRAARALTRAGGIAEVESLNTDVTPACSVEEPTWRYGMDFYRQIVSGAHQSGQALVTTELAAFVQRFQRQIFLTDYARMMANEWAVGVTRPILHGYSYSPPGFEFPGRDHWLGAVAESWNHRTYPEWRHMSALADYFARGSLCLEQGTAVSDIAIYRDGPIPLENLFTRGNTEFFNGLPLDLLGFSYQYIDPAGLLEPEAAGAGRLYPRTAGYRALVLDERTLPAEVARAVADLAEAGLAVVLVGEPPSTGGRFRDLAAEDAELQAAITRLLGSSRCRVVDEQRDVAEALLALGVRPDVHVLTPTQLHAQHRKHADADVYYLYNPLSHPTSVTVSLLGTGAPALLDLWTGEQKDLGQYRVTGGRTELTLRLDATHGVVVVLERTQEAVSHATVSNAEAVQRDGGDLVFSLPGTSLQLTAELSSGGRLQRRLDQLPPALQVSQWTLTVDGVSADGTTTYGPFLLSQLVDWREIPELADVSGVGTYEGSIRLRPEWLGPEYGTVLVLPHAQGSLRVFVNEEPTAPDLRGSRRVDITRLVKEGENAIRIELATTLANVLAGEDADPGTTQAYGLIGPVVVEPEHRVRVQTEASAVARQESTGTAALRDRALPATGPGASAPAVASLLMLGVAGLRYRRRHGPVT